MRLEGARVLVTGGNGFFGRHIGAALVDAGAVPLAVGRADADLRDGAAVSALFDRLGPDLVVHAAAVGGGIGWMRAHPATALADNALINTNVLATACDARVRRLVGISSACAYPVDAPQPMREETIFSGEPEPTNGPYGHAKRLMLVHGAALHAEHGFDCAFLVPTNLYGPGDDVTPERSHVVGALLRRFDDAVKAGAHTVICWGSGRATRDLLHVRDAAAAVVRALEVGPGPAPINVGSGLERTVAEIAHAVALATGFRGTIDWDPSRPDGMPRKVLDISRARAALHWAPDLSLADGLAEVVQWYRS